MQWNKYIGEKGEKLAIEWLKRDGFTILIQNLRIGRYEIDIVASKDNLLHLIEVKTRSNNTFGFPETRIDAKKLADLGKAAEMYLLEHPEWKEAVFDVLSIMLNAKTEDTYFLIEDIRI